MKVNEENAQMGKEGEMDEFLIKGTKGKKIKTNG